MVPVTIWRSEKIATEQAAIDREDEVTVIE